MPNVFRPVFEPGDGPHAYAALGRLAGARGTDLRLYRLEPGEAVELAAGAERLMVVTRGGPSVEAEAGRRHLAPGDVWVWPESRVAGVANLTADAAEVMVVVSRPASGGARAHASASRSGIGRAPARRRP